MCDAAFGERLRAVRHERGLTQIELAADANMSVRHISDYERGNHDPRLATVRRLAAALSVDTAELVKD